jgi:alkylation response protein AidB-like acyl-CoA dehydrogenase
MKNMQKISSLRYLRGSPSRFSQFRFSSSTIVDRSTKTLDLFNPTEEHASLRQMLRNFVETEVDPQALQFNREERFNEKLFRKLGTLGLLGMTVEQEYGGSGMDATAAVIAHGNELFDMSLRVVNFL